jgi:hypothetical protein
LNLLASALVVGGSYIAGAMAPVLPTRVSFFSNTSSPNTAGHDERIRPEEGKKPK